MKNILVYLFLSTMFLIACSAKVDLSTPDFQASFLPYFDVSGHEEVLLAIVNDNSTQEERDHFAFPEEWEVYLIHLEEDTLFLDEKGTEITKEEAKMHDYMFNVWTKEAFQSQWTDVLTEEGSSKLIIDYIPAYSVSQIQLVNMTDDEYLALDYARNHGDFHLQVYVGEGFNNEKINLQIQDEVWEAIDLNKSQINSVGFKERPSERKAQLLSITEYPTFILFDNEKLLIKTNQLGGVLEYMTQNSK
ncbi:hypothetical protein [Alkalihalobacterium elongatum]|uniref:hypothetical protein n=1 Tax=Alkalihalobacterium elongatum TaxID=2675466 RepID=UPI001C1FF75D|nr:hypothetical protein [Alkalihalobacterium elongatum]